MSVIKSHHPAYRYVNLIDSLFNEFSNPSAPALEKGKSGFVPVNIHETNEAYHLELSAPGLKKEDFVLKLEKGLLSISVEQKEEKKEENTQNGYTTIRREFNAKGFTRSFTLDEKIQEEGINAKYEDGILKVFLPKKAPVEASSKLITIQ